MSAGAPTRCGPARRNGRSKGCAGSKSPRTCRRNIGYAPLGAADGPVKTAIFGGNNARLYNIQPKRAMLELKGDRFALMKAEYEKAGPEPSNMRYGYVVPNGPVDHSVFA